MRGTCERCVQHQREGIPDYCCVLCVLQASGLGGAPKRMTPDGTVIIDLSHLPPSHPAWLPQRPHNVQSF